MTSRQLKNLNQAILEADVNKVEAIFVEIKQVLTVQHFIPGNIRYQSGLLVTLLQQVLPITYHQNIKLRLHAESFLNHLSSLVAAFHPSVLLDAYNELDALTPLQPAAQSACFNFFTNSLRSVSPKNRINYIGTYHCTLMCSKPDKLSNISRNVWALLRESLTVSNIYSILKLIINSQLVEEVAFLSLKSPVNLLPLVFERMSSQNLKEFIRYWPKSQFIDIRLLLDRILAGVSSNNSSERSTVLEIIELLIRRINKFMPKTQVEPWKQIFGSVKNLWLSDKITIAQKAAIISLLNRTAQAEIIDIDDLKQFLIYGYDLSVTIQIAIIHMSITFVLHNQIPKGFLEFLTKQAIDRDPLLYVATLYTLRKCFNILYDKLPKQTEELFFRCLNPPPRYFVEQIQVLKVFKKINWEKFPFNNIKKHIILYFLKEPHPSVVAIIKDMKHDVTIGELDWFENTASYLPLFQDFDPQFVIELMDMNLISPASFPLALKSIQNSPNSMDLFSRALSLIFAALKALQIEPNFITKDLTQLASEKLTKITDSMSSLLNIINSRFEESAFGQIVSLSLDIILNTISKIKLRRKAILGLISIAATFATCFTSTCCQLLMKLVDKYNKRTEALDQAIDEFFDKELQFDDSYLVARAAIATVPREKLNKVIDYLNVASEKDRDILFITFVVSDDEIPPHPTFLAVKDEQEYVQKCIQEIPFESWVIDEDDFEFIQQLSDIKVTSDLDEIHSKVVKMFPDTFKIIENEINDVEPAELTLEVPDTFKISDTRLDVEWVDKEPEEEEVSESDKIPITAYKYREPNMYELFTFLWFSKRNFLSIDEWVSLEDFVVKNKRNERLVSAFFSYAIRNFLPVDTEKWSTNIIVHRNSFYSMLTVCIYFYFIHKDWDDLTKSQHAMIERTMLELGYPDASEASLYRAFQQETDFKKMIVEFIIRIDIKRFANSSILEFIDCRADDFIEKFDLIIDAMKNTEQDTIVPWILINKIFPPLPISLSEHVHYPPEVPMLDKYKKPQISIVPISKRKPLDPRIAEKLVVFVENYRTCDLWIFHLLSNVLMSKELVKRLIAVIPEGHPLESCRDDVELIDFLHSRFFHPPSFTRETIKYLIQIKQDNRDNGRVLTSYLPVFFDLLFEGYENMSLKLCDNRFPIIDESFLYQRNWSSEVVTRFKKTLHKSGKSSMILSVQIFQMRQEDVCTLFSTMNVSTAYLEIGLQLLNVLKSRGQYLTETIEIILNVLNHVSKEQLLTLITDEAFLNAEKMINVFVVIKMFQKSVFESVDKGLRGNWGIVEEMIKQRITDPKRLEIFELEDPLEGLARSLTNTDI